MVFDNLDQELAHQAERTRRIEDFENGGEMEELQRMSMWIEDNRMTVCQKRWRRAQHKFCEDVRVRVASLPPDERKRLYKVYYKELVSEFWGNTYQRIEAPAPIVNDVGAKEDGVCAPTEMDDDETD